MLDWQLLMVEQQRGSFFFNLKLRARRSHCCLTHPRMHTPRYECILATNATESYVDGFKDWAIAMLTEPISGCICHAASVDEIVVAMTHQS